MPKRECYTAEEISSKLANLSDADWGRVVLVAQHCANGTGLKFEELLEKTFKHLVFGKNKIPRSVDFVQFFCLSLADVTGDERPQQDTGIISPEQVVTFHDDDNITPMNDMMEDLTPELLAQIEEKFYLDPDLLKYIKGIKSGLTGEKLRIFVGRDEEDMDALRERLGLLKRPTRGH
jgi:hypothetical protein